MWRPNNQIMRTSEILSGTCYHLPVLAKGVDSMSVVNRSCKSRCFPFASYCCFYESDQCFGNRQQNPMMIAKRAQHGVGTHCKSQNISAKNLLYGQIQLCDDWIPASNLINNKALESVLQALMFDILWTSTVSKTENNIKIWSPPTHKCW